jgi:type IV secretory pathway TrbL component
MAKREAKYKTADCGWKRQIESKRAIAHATATAAQTKRNGDLII